MNIEKFSFNCYELNISKDSLAEIMGYSPKSLPQYLIEPIDEVFKERETFSEIEGGYRIVDSIHFNDNESSIIAEGVSFHTKKIVYNQIKRATRLAVFVCTAGKKISERSRQLMDEGDLLTGYVFDSFGSLVVETAMDLIQNNLKEKLLPTNLNITNRYSPGYCGWDIAEQKKLFGMLPEKFCGIELSDSCLMSPIKSVSGIIGIGESVKFSSYTCSICDSQNCIYRKLRNKK